MVVEGYSFIQKAILKLEERFQIMQRADIAAFYLQQDIHAAGYRGYRSCDSSLLDINHITKTKLNFLFTPGQLLSTRTVTSSYYIQNLPKKITDKILRQKLKYNANLLLIKDIPKAVYNLARPLQDPCAAIQIHNGSTLHDGACMAIADLNAIERFVASNVIAGNYIYRRLAENDNICLHKQYNIDAEVIAFTWIAYYLAKVAIDDATYTLYRDDLTGHAERLIEGVEDFYVNLINSGQNSHGKLPTVIKQQKQLVVANKTTTNKSLQDIVGVEVGLLLRSDNPFFKEQEILWRSKTHKFTDGYLRQPLVFIIALRNVC